MSKEFEFAVIISGKFVNFLWSKWSQTLVGHSFKDDRVILAAMTHWTVTQNTESIGREYESLLRDIY